MTIAFISEAEFRARNPEVDLSRYSSTTISGVLSDATKKAESFLEYPLAFEAGITEKAESYVSSDLDLVITTKRRPIRSLTSVKVQKGGYSGTLTLLKSDGTPLYDIPGDSNEIYIPGYSVSFSTISLIDFRALRGIKFFTEIVYDAGYYLYDRPGDIVDAVSLYARDFFARALNVAGAKSISQGNVSISYASRDGKSDNVQDAEELLSHYKDMGVW